MMEEQIKCPKCKQTYGTEHFPLKPKLSARYLCCLRCRSKPRNIPPDTSNINFELAQRIVEPQLYRYLRPDIMNKNLKLERDVKTLEKDVERLKEELQTMEASLSNYNSLDKKGLVFLNKPPSHHHTFTWFLDSWNYTCHRSEMIDADIYEILPMQSAERIDYINGMKKLIFRIALEVANNYKIRNNGERPARAKIPNDLFENGRTGKKNVYYEGDEQYIFNIIRSHLDERLPFVSKNRV